MRWLIVGLLPLWSVVHAQGGPGLMWDSTPVEGIGEFHGLLKDGDRLLAWGDAGADSVRRAQFRWLDDANGQPLGEWTDALPRSRFRAARQDADGWLLVGEARRGQGESRALLMRLSTPGDSVWLREPDWGGACALHAVAPLADGGWLVGGERRHQALLARLDAQGDTLWTREFEFFPDYEDVFYDVDELPDGRLVACGQTFHDWIEWTSRFAVLGWFDAQGGLLDLFQPYDAQMFALEPLADGRLAVTGDFQFAYLPVWLGSSSQDMTHQYFGVRERDMQARDLRQCMDGGLAVAGRWQTEEGEMAALLLRLDDQGEEIWRAAYDICGIDMGWGLASGEDGSHRIAGYCMPSRTAFLLRTWPETSPVPPPPVRASEGVVMVADETGASLRWERPAPGGLRLEAYNLLGQRIWSRPVPAGISRLDVPLQSLAAGNYVLRLEGPAVDRTWSLPWRP